MASGIGELSCEHYATSAFDIATSLASFGNKEFRHAAFEPGIYFEGLGSNGGNIRFGQQTSSTGHPTLAEVEYITPGNAIIEASKPSLQGELTINQRCENLGHHDLNLGSIGRGTVKYNPTKSVLPDNHVELFKNSISFWASDGKIYRYAQDEFGNIHRFQPSSNGINDYHWSSSTNGRTLSGEPKGLENIPPQVRRAFK